MAVIAVREKDVREKSQKVEAALKAGEPVSDQEFHLLLDELRDENSRSRLREAAWVSIIFHLVLLFVVKESPRFFPVKNVSLITPQQQIAESDRAKELKFLELPPDASKYMTPKPSEVISDQNRVAQSRNPQLDRQMQELLRDNRRPNPAGAPIPQPQQRPAPPQQMAQQQPQQQPQQQAPQQSTGQYRMQQQPQNQIAELQTPNMGGGAFPTIPSSAGSAIQQAARATVHQRGGYGDYGSGPAQQAANRGDLDILSDTMGVDFAPYLSRVKQQVQTNWWNIIPEVARPPLMKQGRVVIEFVIMKNGQIGGIKMNSNGYSGDISLDRAAWGGITASNPFQPLPSEFKGEYLALRFYFYYNPDKSKELR